MACIDLRFVSQEPHFSAPQILRNMTVPEKSRSWDVGRGPTWCQTSRFFSAKCLCWSRYSLTFCWVTSYGGGWAIGCRWTTALTKSWVPPLRPPKGRKSYRFVDVHCGETATNKQWRYTEPLAATFGGKKRKSVPPIPVMCEISGMGKNTLHLNLPIWRRL